MTRKAIPMLAVLMILSAACVIAVVDRSTDGRPWPVRSEFRKSMDLASGGIVILDNTDGDIEVSGWGEERVEITAYRSRDLPASAGVHFMGGRFSPPDIMTQAAGEAVTIKTEGEKREKDRGTVDYFLKVPRSVRFDRISNGQGDIRISDIYGRIFVDAGKGRVAIGNYSGSLEIRLEQGSVEAELLDLRPEDNVRIKVGMGDVVLYLEPGIAASFSLETSSGTISSELDLRQRLPARKVASKTGDDGALLEVTALQGSIRIRKVEVP